jgi:hypothetical protein
VKSLKKSHATWDPVRESWTEFGLHDLVSFRTDGKVHERESLNPDGSAYFCEWHYGETGEITHLQSGMRGGAVAEARYFYDDRGRHIRTAVIHPDGSAADSETSAYDDVGRRTKTVFLRDPPPRVSYQIEGTQTSVGAPGATTMSTTYDDNDLTSEASFLDVEGKLVTRATLVRDGVGRLVKEEVTMDVGSQFQGLYSEEDQRALEAAIGQIFAGIFSSTTYAYDDRGRLIERGIRMGNLSSERTRYRHEDRSDPVEETTERENLEASLNEDGTLRYVPRNSHIQHSRYEYVYDAHGNWVSRKVSSRLETEPEFRLSNICRREIEYYNT